MLPLYGLITVVERTDRVHLIKVVWTGQTFPPIRIAAQKGQKRYISASRIELETFRLQSNITVERDTVQVSACTTLKVLSGILNVQPTTPSGVMLRLKPCLGSCWT
jgi:hypothetical protein